MVYLDTNILVYLLEGHLGYSRKVAVELDNLRNDGEQFLTSVITVTEFLAGTSASTITPLRRLNSLQILNLNEDLAVSAAKLQKKHGMKIGDAIHLATAVEQRAELFFTNDKQLAAVAKRYIKVKTL